MIPIRMLPDAKSGSNGGSRTKTSIRDFRALQTSSTRCWRWCGNGVRKSACRRFRRRPERNESGRVSVLVLYRSKPPETLNLPDYVKAGIEEVWLISTRKTVTPSILEEIMTELVSPKESAAFTAQTNHMAAQEPEVAVRSKAFTRLAYIANRSTVRQVASFLTDTTHPPQKPTDVRYVSYAEMAADTLSQMVTNAPPTTNFSAQDKIRAWQQWWEQNKDKYP